MKKKTIIAIASLLCFGQGVWAETVSLGGHLFNKLGDDIYEIQNEADLSALAQYVNEGNTCDGLKFKLTGNLDYSVDENNDGEPDYTFTPIGMGEDLGTVDKPFMGFFDGNNNIIKNISYTNTEVVGVGLFGYIYGATIENLTLEHCQFTGKSCVGGIVGNTSASSHIINNCHVSSDCGIILSGNDACYAGGIVGNDCSGTIINCTSAATITGEGFEYVGGIVGGISAGTIQNCTSSASVTGNNSVGGIAGNTETTIDETHKYIVTITGCFYTGESTFTGNGKGVIVGTRGGCDECNLPITGSDELTINITLLNDDSNATVKNATRIANYDGETVNVTLSGRTLYKDGHWNTLCLPFDVSTGDEPLSGDGVSAMTLDTSSSNLTDNTLTLEFSATTVITAGTPFIIKWDSGSDLTSDLEFTNVTIKKAPNNTDVGEHVTFTGTYSPVVIGAGGDNTKLYLGGDDTLYYPDDDMTIGAFRAYFQLNGITAGAAAARAFVLNFGDDDATGIGATLMSSEKVNSEAWHSLDGRKLNSKPTQKGLYIYKGKKMVVK